MKSAELSEMKGKKQQGGDAEKGPSLRTSVKNWRLWRFRFFRLAARKSGKNT